ncbi:MAG: hypothetical protein JRI97_07375 [Deltaproteobacteria bacterium]|nr:hypothetical protein [Deltaproteobacteria bacterium]
MPLDDYKKKRDFEKTPEPPGGRADLSGRTYAIQKHDASRLHYDLRLRSGEVLKSWALPKGPSTNPSQKRLAVLVEDHPLEYAGFEGVIPEGEYGGGTVMLWDRGTWEPLGDPDAMLAAGRLSFVLHGERLSGRWALVRMSGKRGEGGKNWLLIKHKDEAAETEGEITARHQTSVATGRTMEEIADQGKIRDLKGG